MTEKLIIFRANSLSGPGWEDRKLMPSGALTSILAEQCWFSAKPLPEVGERLGEYTNLEDPGNGLTHRREGDWVVSQVRQYPEVDGLIMVLCDCEFQPIEPQWEALKRGSPIGEVEAVVTLVN